MPKFKCDNLSNVQTMWTRRTLNHTLHSVFLVKIKMLNNLRPFIQPAAINFFYGGMEVLKLVLKSVNVVLDISVSGPSMLFQTSCSLLSAMLVHPKNTLALLLCDLLEATTCPLITLLENIKLCPNIQFSEKNNKIVNTLISISFWIFTQKVVKIQQFSVIVDSVLTQNYDFWRENSNHPGKTCI